MRFLNRLLDALGLAGATMQQRRLPAHADFVNLPFRQSDRVVLLQHAAVGTVLCRQEDPEEVEDVYVVSTDDGRFYVAPEGGLRLALEA